MKADQIIKNAKIFTADGDNPHATALAVKDGKFVYVGDEAGLSAYEGEVTDLGGKFVMPGIIDSHVHVTMPVGFEYADKGERIESNGKQEALDFMADFIRKNPDIDLILMDIQLPDINGYEVTKQVRTFNTNVPIIAQTAYAMYADVVKALEAGCNDFIAKPIKLKKMQLLNLLTWIV